MRCKCCNLRLGDIPYNKQSGELDDMCTTCRSLSNDTVEDKEYVQGMCSESVFNQLKLTGKLTVSEIDYNHDLLNN